MPKIKLFKVYGGYGYNSDVLQDCSEGWQEVTEEELNFLTSYNGRLALSNKFRYEVCVYEDKTHEISEKIKDIKEFIKDHEEKERLKTEEQARKNIDKLLKKEAKEIEKAKKLLEAKGML